MTIEKTAQELAELVGGEVAGDGTVRVTRVAAPADARPDSLVFAEDERSLTAARNSGAGVVVAPRHAGTAGGKTLIRTGNPRLAFARIAALLHPEPRPAPGIHPTAVVDATAALGSGVSVGPHAVVEARAEIGDRVILGPGAVVGAGARVGADSRLHPRVVLYPGVTLGERVVVHAGAVLGADGFGYVDGPEGKVKFPQLGTLVVEDDVEIGANAALDRGALEATVIRRGTKIDNLVQIAHNVEIGRNCAVSAQTGIAGTTKLGDGVVMGGQCGIGDHGVIGDGIVMGARSTLFSGKRLEGPGLYFGHPARPLREELRRMAAPERLQRLAVRVQALEKRLERLEGEVE